MEKRGQVASEYLGIVIIVLIILIPVLILYIRYSGETKDAIASSKIESIVNELSKAANQVYVYGEGTQNSISVTFPENIDYIETGEHIKDGKTTSGKNEIVFHMINSKKQSYDIVKVVDAELKSKAIGISDSKFTDSPQGRVTMIVKACQKDSDGKVRVGICIKEFANNCPPC